MRSPIAASALVALGIAGWFAFGSSDLSLDDAWIHLAYAKSLRLGEGLSYNPHDFETGSSSPLWVLLLAALPWGTSPVLATKILGATLHATTAALAAHVGGQLGDAQRARERIASAWLAGLLCAVEPSLAHAATSGMEVPLAAACLVAMTAALFARRGVLAAVLGAAGALARPETVVFAAVLSAGLALAERRSRRLLVLAGPAIALGAWFGYDFAVSGYPLPNTFYMKGSLSLSGLPYLAVRVVGREPWWFSVAALAVIFSGWRRPFDELSARRGALFVGGALALVAVALSRVFDVGVLFYCSRYFTPFEPALVVVAAVSAVRLGRLRAPRIARAVALAVSGILLGTAASSLPARRNELRSEEKDITQLHTRPAERLGTFLPHDAVLAVEGAGASRFFAPRSMRVMDLMGLNHRAIAHAAPEDRIGVVVREHPTHFLIPDDFLPLFMRVFDLEALARFDDASYAQTVDRTPRRVWLLGTRLK